MIDDRLNSKNIIQFNEKISKIIAKIEIGHVVYVLSTGYNSEDC